MVNDRNENYSKNSIMSFYTFFLWESLKEAAYSIETMVSIKKPYPKRTLYLHLKQIYLYTEINLMILLIRFFYGTLSSPVKP